MHEHAPVSYDATCNEYVRQKHLKRSLNIVAEDGDLKGREFGEGDEKILKLKKHVNNYIIHYYIQCCLAKFEYECKYLRIYLIKVLLNGHVNVHFSKPRPSDLT